MIPIVNENDSVSYKEIESEERLFSDNDVLSAVVAVLCQADKLIILSLAGGAGSRRGTGGMRTKLRAADIATAQGIDTVVTNGKDPAILFEVVAGESVGTLFKGHR